LDLLHQKLHIEELSFATECGANLMPSPQFQANTAPNDPYKNYRFKVKWDDTYVAGINKVGMLKRSTEVVNQRAGDPSLARLSPGQSAYDPITLEQGVTHDISFEQWANKAWNYHNSTGTDADASLKDFRKDITIELYNESGQKVLGYNVYRCWVSEFQALPELEGSGNAVAIQILKLENEGWERDTSVTEPTEADFSAFVTP
jgi:phage tail-like protein